MSEWVSVRDRLPEIGVEVLVYDCGFMGVWSLNKTDQGVFWEDGHGDQYSVDEVTHWMPLPEPPEEGRK